MKGLLVGELSRLRQRFLDWLSDEHPLWYIIFCRVAERRDLCHQAMISYTSVCFGARLTAGLRGQTVLLCLDTSSVFVLFKRAYNDSVVQALTWENCQRADGRCRVLFVLYNSAGGSSAQFIMGPRIWLWRFLHLRRVRGVRLVKPVAVHWPVYWIGVPELFDKSTLRVDLNYIPNKFTGNLNSAVQDSIIWSL